MTRNREAKRLAIPDLEPYFKIKPFLDKHNVHVFSSNYELYGDVSHRIMTLLGEYGCSQEIYSIDECFLDIAGEPNLVAHGKLIKREVWRQQRMPVCVGISHTKTLAKLANHIAKKSVKLEGICVIDELTDWYPVFRKIPVDKVWGVGRRLSKRMNLMGIHTAKDLMTKPPRLMRQEFGITIERTIRELNGEKCLDFETQPSPKKQIFCSRSFGEKIETKQALEESLANYAFRASEKLRRQNSSVQKIYVMAQSSHFAHDRYSNSAVYTLPYRTNDSCHIVEAARYAASKLFRPGVKFARAGVGLLDLEAYQIEQYDFFQHGQNSRSRQLMESLDKINRRYGSGTAFVAAQGTDRIWSMSRKMKSPSYTTRFSDIPLVRL